MTDEENVVYLREKLEHVMVEALQPFEGRTRTEAFQESVKAACTRTLDSLIGFKDYSGRVVAGWEILEIDEHSVSVRPMYEPEFITITINVSPAL